MLSLAFATYNVAKFPNKVVTKGGGVDSDHWSPLSRITKKIIRSLRHMVSSFSSNLYPPWTKPPAAVCLE